MEHGFALVELEMNENDTPAWPSWTTARRKAATVKQLIQGEKRRETFKANCGGTLSEVDR